MPPLSKLCHLAYGPLANRLESPRDEREREAVLARGHVPCLALAGADFDPEGYPVSEVASAEPDTGGELVYAPRDLLSRFGVSPHTLLYLAKGSQHRACLPDFRCELPLLTGSSFVRLDIRDPGELLREYLFAQLRSPRTWRQLEVRQEGAFIKNINRAALAALEVDVPPVERQRAVVEYARLHRRATQLRARLSELSNQRLNALLNPDRR